MTPFLGETYVRHSPHLSLSITFTQRTFGGQLAHLYEKDALPLINQRRQNTEGMQNADPNQWSGLILSSSTTRLLTQGLLLSNASVNNDDTITMPKYVRLKCYNHDLRKHERKDIL